MARLLTKTWSSPVRTNLRAGASTPANPTGEGFILLELIAATAIILVLATVALPMARVHIVRSRESELRRDLRELREAIDHYKNFADAGLVEKKVDTFGYPPDLETLVAGVPVHGNASVKYKFLRQIPVDPMTGRKEWGLKSMQDDPDSRGWGGQNVFDVYSQSQGKGLDGTDYGEW
jgi:general secretion pathway protein G